MYALYWSIQLQSYKCVYNTFTLLWCKRQWHTCDVSWWLLVRWTQDHEVDNWRRQVKDNVSVAAYHAHRVTISVACTRHPSREDHKRIAAITGNIATQKSRKQRRGGRRGFNPHLLPWPIAAFAQNHWKKFVVEPHEWINCWISEGTEMPSSACHQTEPQARISTLDIILYRTESKLSFQTALTSSSFNPRVWTAESESVSHFKETPTPGPISSFHHHFYLFIKQFHKNMTADNTWTGPTRLAKHLQWQQ